MTDLCRQSATAWLWAVAVLAAVPAGAQEMGRDGVPRWLTAGGAAAPAPASGPGPAIMFRAQHYDVMKPVLRPGDVAFALCVRDLHLGGARPKLDQWPYGHPEPHLGEKPQPAGAVAAQQLDPQRFAAAVAALNAVNDPRVTKALVFSSLEDLLRYQQALPRDVACVDYNSEPGLTPLGELTSLETALVQFAEVVHKQGRKVGWAPTNTMLRQSSEKLLGLSRLVDRVILEQQRVLQYDGGDAMVRLTQTHAALIRRANPQCQVVVQMVVGRGAKGDLVRAGRAVAPLVDALCFFTTREPAEALEIVQAVRK